MTKIRIKNVVAGRVVKIVSARLKSDHPVVVEEAEAPLEDAVRLEIEEVLVVIELEEVKVRLKLETEEAEVGLDRDRKVPEVGLYEADRNFRDRNRIAIVDREGVEADREQGKVNSLRLNSEKNNKSIVVGIQKRLEENDPRLLAVLRHRPRAYRHKNANR